MFFLLIDSCLVITGYLCIDESPIDGFGHSIIIRLFHRCISSLIYQSMKDTVTKTMQLFKVTHQDRWETEFKAEFSRSQLEDLQGAGAAHYFS